MSLSVSLHFKPVDHNLEGMQRALMEEAAFVLEGLTKVKITDNGQVDTGFMRSSVYHLTQNGSSFTGSPGQDGQRQAPQVGLGDAGAAVAVGAEYAIYQEVRNSFLWASVDQLKARWGLVVASVKDRVNG